MNQFPPAHSSPQHLSDEQKPRFAIVTATHIADESSVGGRRVANTYVGLSYNLVLYDTSGLSETNVANVAPSQQRYDCAFYPAMPGDIADVYWVGDSFYFKLTEIPTSTLCPTVTAQRNLIAPSFFAQRKNLPDIGKRSGEGDR